MKRIITFITIYYIKRKTGEVVYTNTNPNEFGKHVKELLNLKVDTFPTYKVVKDKVRTNETDYVVGKKGMEIEL